VNNLVTNWLRLGKLFSFRCFNIVDQQRRTIDVIEDPSLIVCAGLMRHLDFRYIQKSQVCTVENSKIIIVSIREGQSLAQSIAKTQISFGEHRLRSLLRSLLEAIYYVNKQFGFDFSFGAHDVLCIDNPNSENRDRQNEKFKFKNCFLQKFCSKFERDKNANFRDQESLDKKQKFNDGGTALPVKCIRSLGALAIQLVKNRFGVNEICLELNAPGLSESLRALVVEMANFRPAFGKVTENFLRRLMSLSELREDRTQSFRLVKPSQLRRYRSQEIRQSTISV